MRKSPASLSGFISFGLIRLIIPIALLWGGGQGLYTALTNRQPLSVTFAEYVAKKPEAMWVELKETKLDLVGAFYGGKLGAVSELYVPMVVPGGKEEAPIQALLHTKDQGMIELYKQMKNLPEKEILAFVLKNHERVFPVKTVQGLTQFGIESDGKKRGKIAKLADNLAADFAVIDDGKKPEMGLSLFLLGLTVPAAWLCWFRRSGGSAPAAATASAGGVPPPLPK